MLPIVLGILAAIAVGYGLMLVMRLVKRVVVFILTPIVRIVVSILTPIARSVIFILTPIVRVACVLIALLFLVFLSKMSFFLVDPWLRNVLNSFLPAYFQKITLSTFPAVASIIFAAIVTLYLIYRFGKTQDFKSYGNLAIFFNSFLAILMVLLVFYPSGGRGISNRNATNFSVLDAVSTLCIYLKSVNISTILFYYYDKSIAKQNDEVERRVPEWILHWHSICGGSLGALFAQQVFKHKTKKEKFQRVYRRILLAQAALLAVIYYIRNKGF